MCPSSKAIKSSCHCQGTCTTISSVVAGHCSLSRDAGALRPIDEEEADDFSDDEELQSPIDEVDPFLYFMDTVKASDPIRVQNLAQSLEFEYQVLANGIAQHAEQRWADREGENGESICCYLLTVSSMLTGIEFIGVTGNKGMQRHFLVSA